MEVNSLSRRVDAASPPGLIPHPAGEGRPAAAHGKTREFQPPAVDPLCWSTTAKSFASPSSTKVRPPNSRRSMKFRAAFGSMKPMRLISVSAQNVLLGIITLNDSHPPLNDRTAASLLTTTDIASINTANSISYADADIFKGRCYV